MPAGERNRIISEMQKEMQKAAERLDFERAAELGI